MQLTADHNKQSWMVYSVSIPGLQCWELSDCKMKRRSSSAEIGRRHAADHIISVAWFTVCADLQCWELFDHKMKRCNHKWLKVGEGIIEYHNQY